MPSPEQHDVVAALEARLLSLEEELSTHRRRRRFGWIIAAVLVAVGTAFAADGNCPNGYAYCFIGGQPARAPDVNHNFAQIREWLEAKVGTRGQPVSVAEPATFASDVSINGTTSLRQVNIIGTLTPTGLVNIAGTNGQLVYSGFQTSCVEGNSSAPQQFPWCCRINVRDGAVSCRLASNLTTWSTNGIDPFAAGVESNYSLACFAGVPGINFPGCCRTETKSGAVSCRIATNWQLTAWATPVTPSF